MIVSIEWLSDYVSLPADLSASRIAHDLTMATVEVEGVRNAGEPFRNMIVADITAVEPHPVVEALRVVRCDVGGGSVVSLVSGAPDVAVGARVAVALPGARVTEGVEGQEQRHTGVLEAREVRGVPSMGMLCAPEAIGLDSLFSPGRLIDLSAFPCKPGDALSQVIGFDDVLLEIDNKSLTNRPDLWGHHGIARELAAIYGLALKPLPAAEVQQRAETLAVEIGDVTRCARYTATRIAGVAAVDSPFWMRSRLLRVGQRPIDFLVDLTNYAMLAVGQPSHAFDAARLRYPIEIRLARPDEEIQLLGGRTIRAPERQDDATLVVADQNGPVALAGVMGGDRSAVSPSTRELLLEMANFAPVGVRRTAAAVGARTESSTRFEKGLSPLLIDAGLGVLLALLRTVLPDARVVEHVDVFPRSPAPIVIDVPVVFIQKKLGNALPEETIRATLDRLGFGVATDGGVLSVTVPWWRATGDVSIPEDIVEEVGRLHGYEKLTFVPPHIALTHAVRQPRVRMERRLKEYLAERGEMREVVTYPWIDEEYEKAAGLDEAAALTLHSPPAPTRRRLRTSLIPGLLEVVSSNVRRIREMRVFELGRVFEPEWEPGSAGTDERLPRQPKRVAAALAGADAEQLFFLAKGLLEALPRGAQTEPLTLVDEDAGARWADPRGRLAVWSGDRVVGTLGALTRRALRLSRIRGAQVVAFELDVDGITPLPSRTNQYAPLSTYPEVDFDLSFLVDVAVRWADVQRVLVGASPLVAAVHFLEEYRGEPVPPGRKSLAVRLRLGAMDRTLTSADIDAAATAAAATLAGTIGAEIRSQQAVQDA